MPDLLLVKLVLPALAIVPTGVATAFVMATAGASAVQAASFAALRVTQSVGDAM